MHAVNRRAARVAARCLVVPLAVAPLLFTAQPAFAHTDLVTGSPAEAASESRPPQTIKLTFSDEMTSRYAKVALTAPDGEPGAAGAPQVTGRTVTLPVKPGLPAGSYTVGYRVVSADGHPVTGSYRFTVEEAASAPAPTPTRTPTPTPTPARTADASRTDDASSTPDPPLPVVAIAGGLFLLAAAGVSVAVTRRRRTRHGS
ncbi:copper resistance CopC family protein [Streptomyces niveus]|uniref:copper resistance CopC family protein n=1 Tax=Streptomyces niveus TaxID=193462 RepID=UPI00344D7C8A